MAHRPLSAADGNAESQRRLDAAVFGYWQARAKARALFVALLGTWVLMGSQIAWALVPEDVALMHGLRVAGAAGTLGGLALSLALNLVKKLPPWVDPRKLLT